MSTSEYAQTIQELDAAIHNSADSEFLARRSMSELAAKTEKVRSAEIASDDILDATFSELLQFPGFSLLDPHKENLLNRGLDEEAIVRNGYRSFPEDAQLEKAQAISQIVRSAYEKNGWAQLREKQAKLRRIGDESLMAGLTVGAWLTKRGFQMEGVPGFFRFQGQWAFLIPTSGIVVPTRNMKGQIVALQVRADRGDIRYLTVSASGLDKAVSEKISRVHWPLQNDDLVPDENGDQPEVLITEGPLKADVALHLMKARENSPLVAFAAIQGVTNTSALMTDCDRLVELGYDTVTNALDMDRLTNVNVLKAARRLNGLLRDKGLIFKQLFWDDAAAWRILVEQKSRCEQIPNIEYPARISANPFAAVAQLTVAINAANGANNVVEWPSDSKGIDDFLKSEKEKNK